MKRELEADVRMNRIMTEYIRGAAWIGLFRGKVEVEVRVLRWNYAEEKVGEY